MSKTEIMAELAHLSPEDLAEVRAWLDRVALETTAAEGGRPAARAVHLRSPRLANPAQAGDFRKQVLELHANAAV